MSQVDRGGLSYGIDVRDGFSSNLANFRSEVNKSRAAWRAFRSEFKGTAAETSKIRRDLEATTRTLERRDKVLARSKTEGRRFARELGTQTAAVRENTRAMQAQDRVAVGRIRSLNTETRAVKRLATAYNQLRSARGRTLSSRLNPSTTAASLSPLSSGRSSASPSLIRSWSREYQGLNVSMEKADSTANRISFTFRRLFGIFAAFAAVRAGVSAFAELTQGAIRLNAELEQTRLGVAGLLIALGDVSSPTGVIADDAERLSAAQGEARRQVELLRGEALKTSATFQELADTFQIALAPGFQAGLDLDEIRRLTIRISQAATAIGLPQNQLPEEIRSLLTGTITPRTTRIATALGITNEDIRNAREAGELVEFLDEKFQAFAVAGDAALKNFSTILTNLKDGLGQILRLGGFNFFDAFKNELNDILGLIASVNDEGNIVFNPEAIEVVEAIADGLAAAVREASRLREALELDDALNIAKLIGKTIAGLSRTAGPLIESLLTVLSAAGELVSFLSSLGFVNDLVLTIVGNALVIAGALRTILLVLGTVRSILPVITTQLVVMRSLIFTMVNGTISWRIALATALRSLLLVAPVLGLIAIAFTGLRSQAEDTQVASEALLEAMRETPSVIARSNNELEEQEEIIKKLTDRFEQASNAFEVSVATAGLSGAVAAQRRQAIELSQETRDLRRQSILEQNRLEELRLQKSVELLEAESRINDLHASGGLLVADTNKALQESQEITQQIADLRHRIVLLTDGQGQDDEARADQLRDQVKELEKQQELLAEELTRQVALSLVLDEDAKELLDASGLSFAKAAASQFGDQFRDVTLNNLKSLLDFNLEGLAGIDDFLPSEEELQRADEEILKIVDKLKEVQQVEAEIQSILNQQEEARKSQVRLSIAQGQVRALESRARAEEVIGPFVFERTNKDPLSTGGDASPIGNIVSFINEENEKLRLQERLRNRLERSIESLGNVQRTVAQNALETEQQALDFLLLRNDLEVRAINESLALNKKEADAARIAKEQTDVEDTKTLDLLDDQLILLRQEEVALRQQLDVIKERNALLEREQTDAVSRAEEDLAQTSDSFDNVIAGFREGLIQANEDVGTAFEISAQTTLKAVQGLSELIADSIVDAFDPTSDKTIEQRIGLFFQSIGRMLLQLTIQAILLRSVLAGIGGGTVTAASAATSLAAAMGGFVPAKGYATGGTVGHSPRRPKGLAASDTVPAWLTPGEYVVKKSAVAAYGADAIRAINNMLVDPGSLRSLAGLTARRRSVRMGSKLGFAEGGLIGGGRSSGVSSGPVGDDTGFSMPLVAVPATDATLEALFAGGKNAYFDFLQANQGKVRAVLGLQRA